MKLRSFAPFVLILVFSLAVLGQNGPSSGTKAVRVMAGSEASDLLAGLDKIFAEDPGDDSEAALTRPRVVAEKKPANEYVYNPLPKPATILPLEQEAFDLINAQRAAKGLPALVWNEEVAKVARMHSQNMAAYKFFDHKGLDGLMVNGRADSVGLNKWRSIGENIAFMRGYDHPAEFAIQCWLKSASHRDNLLREDWKESAIGVAQGADGSYYFTQVFLIRR